MSTMLTVALKTRFLVKRYTNIKVEMVAIIHQDSVLTMDLECLSIYRTPLAVNSGKIAAEHIEYF
jgi:hypothetical protein